MQERVIYRNSLTSSDFAEGSSKSHVWHEASGQLQRGIQDIKKTVEPRLSRACLTGEWINCGRAQDQLITLHKIMRHRFSERGIDLKWRAMQMEHSAAIITICNCMVRGSGEREVGF